MSHRAAAAAVAVDGPALAALVGRSDTAVPPLPGAAGFPASSATLPTESAWVFGEATVGGERSEVQVGGADAHDVAGRRR